MPGYLFPKHTLVPHTDEKINKMLIDLLALKQCILNFKNTYEEIKLEKPELLSPPADEKVDPLHGAYTDKGNYTHARKVQEFEHNISKVQDICEQFFAQLNSLFKFQVTKLDSIAMLANEYDQSGNPELQKQAAIIDEFLLELAGEDSKIKKLEFLAAMATELDKTGDPILVKEASVIDQILLTIGRPKGSVEAIKQAEETEIDRLRAKYRQEDGERAYKKPKEQLDKDLKVADTIKAIKDGVKEYRPLEAALSTRTCPDHPGAQMARIGEYIFQCSLDKQVYNYQGGFKTMKGNTVPGGDVSGQTQALNDHAEEHMSFDTRESKLNP